MIVSDEHEEWNMLDSLVKLVKRHKYDVVLMNGDQGNCNNVIGQPVDVEKNTQAAASTERYVNTLEKLAPKMFYLPGNHDAEISFSQDAPKLGKHAVNLHKKHA